MSDTKALEKVLSNNRCFDYASPSVVAQAAAELEQLIADLEHWKSVVEGINKTLGATTTTDALMKIAQLRKQNVQLTDALYKEALRSVDAYALIQRVLYAKGTDTLDRLDIKPFLEWVEAFPKPPICEHGNKPDTCAHCHPRWD